ncbi:hypothetical protein WH47_08455 [Habropoda laboriosa]|uniref:Uncharacterized protein n=1 Tax=Habropoda laboriosa TaxID=597456 RepID=A0A0L7QMZ3_9HYME|nr:hypothetical protein WH47_08455 [Habropoda laboriosa]
MVKTALLLKQVLPRLENLREAIAVKRAGLLNQDKVIFSHDNARPRVTKKPKKFYNNSAIALPKNGKKLWNERR